MTHQPTTRVRIIHSPCAYHGRVGTIAAVAPDQLHPYRVDDLAPWPLWFGDRELVAVYTPGDAA